MLAINYHRSPLGYLLGLPFYEDGVHMIVLNYV